ncbi:MAG TPA: hypothetical protein VMQ65_05090 [Candidatus Limnocylindria bacterium]|nr:hypothetical protein [Candidatus Limnocylindria bacterium]
MARAKHTGRAEARRRYRQANLSADDESLELDDSGPELETAPTRSSAKPAQRPDPQPSGRPGFMAAMRSAYHRADIREDLRHLPMLLRSRALLAAILLVLAGAAAQLSFPGYTGSAFAWELLVLPGSALGPQLVAGFFAPRASYILGFIVGIVQGIVFSVFVTQFASQLGTALPGDQIGQLLTLSFVTGPISGTLFAAAAAWYRRFLALSSPRRAAAARAGSGRTASKSNQSRRRGR